MIPSKAVVLAQPQSMPPQGSLARLRRPSLLPTPLLPVANRALLSHALGWLAEAGVDEAVVVVPEELAEQARGVAGDGEPALKLSWLEQLCGESLRETLDDLTGFLDGQPFVLHLADSLAGQSLRSLPLCPRGPQAESMLMVEESNRVELGDVLQLRGASGGDPPCHRKFNRDAAGVAVMSADALASARDVDLPWERLLEALADRIRDRGGHVRTHGVSDWWRFRGGTDGLLEGNRFALGQVRPDFEDAQLVDSDIQGAVVAHASARIESSVVRGPAIIGPEAHLRDAYVGPYTAIGERVLVEGAEIEHSVVLADASIRHIGGRLEASVVGRNARVFRDFRLPRALRVQIGEDASVSLG